MANLDNLKRFINIEEVIGEFVSLKKKGRSFWANCPFHIENTPSFAVSPEKGFYKCFGCGAKGDAFTFLMELEGMAFPEAVNYLAKKYNVTVDFNNTKEEVKLNNSEKETLYIIYDLANNYYQSKLKDSEESLKKVLPYLKKRQMDSEIIKKFQIGYSLSSWDDFFKFIQNKNYNPEFLNKSGLVIRSKSGNSKNFYDLFRDRLLFPIHNIYGKVIAFAGRKLNDSDKGPKYINSPESPIYIKSNVLYGLFFAKEEIKKNNFCYIVEGYTDLVSLFSYGIKNVVASGGTSLTDHHIKLLSRFTKNITLLFDNDNAGIKATHESINKILSQGLNVKIISLPDNQDPDSFIKNTSKKIVNDFLIDNNKDFVNYKLLYFLNSGEKDLSKRGEIIRDILYSISLIPDTIQKALYITKTSKLLHIDEEILFSALNQILSEKFKKINLEASKINFNKYAYKQIGIDDRIIKNEKDLISLLLKYGHHKIDDNLFLKEYILREIENISFIEHNYNYILNQFINNENDVELNTAYFLKKEPHIQKLVIDILAENIEISPMWESKFFQKVLRETDDLKKTAYISILKLKLNLLKKLILTNSSSLKANINEDTLKEKFKIHHYLKNREKEIVKLLKINSIECF